MLPVLFSEIFPIYTYPLLMGLAWGLSYYWSRQIFEKVGLESIKFRTFYWGLFISSWVGAKLLFVLSTKIYDKLDLLRSQYFWAGGGFVFYGGLIGGFLFCLLALKIKIVTSEIISQLAPVIAFGHGIGRIGCYLVGCCYGQQCFTGLCFHSKIPVQLIEAAFLFAFMFFTFTKMWKRINPINKISFYFLSYSIFRFNIEFFRGDISRGIYGNFSTSQYVSLIIIMLCLTTYFLSLRARHH